MNNVCFPCLSFTSYMIILDILFSPVNYSICESNPCKNGGKCVVDGDLDETLRYNNIFFCDCAVGYIGNLCEGEYNCATVCYDS